MAQQTRVEKQRTERRKEEVTETKAKQSKKEHQDELKAKEEAVIKDIDDLLDEIDGVLEENAEEFVQSYVQKGGE